MNAPMKSSNTTRKRGDDRPIGLPEPVRLLSLTQLYRVCLATTMGFSLGDDDCCSALFYMGVEQGRAP